MPQRGDSNVDVGEVYRLVVDLRRRIDRDMVTRVEWEERKATETEIGLRQMAAIEAAQDTAAKAVTTARWAVGLMIVAIASTLTAAIQAISG